MTVKNHSKKSFLVVGTYNNEVGIDSSDTFVVVQATKGSNADSDGIKQTKTDVCICWHR